MYSSRYYPKKRRYHSSYNRKRIYGSSYQPGYTTQYQKYGRTIPLNSAFPSIPTELPTRQSQLFQVEQLKKAGLIPEPPEPIPGMFNYTIDDLTVQNDHTNPLGLIKNLLNENQGPTGRYIVYIIAKNGLPYYDPEDVYATNIDCYPSIYYICDYDSSADTITFVSSNYVQVILNKDNFGSSSSIGCTQVLAKTDNAAYLQPNCFTKASGSSKLVANTLYIVGIYQIQ